MSAKSHIIYLVIIPDYENNLEFHFFRRGARATFTNMPLTQSGGAGYLGAGWLCDGTVMLPVLITPVVAGLHLFQQLPTATNSAGLNPIRHLSERLAVSNRTTPTSIRARMGHWPLRHHGDEVPHQHPRAHGPLVRN
mgnify:CR=1 FL=1